MTILWRNGLKANLQAQEGEYLEDTLRPNLVLGTGKSAIYAQNWALGEKTTKGNGVISTQSRKFTAQKSGQEGWRKPNRGG